MRRNFGKRELWIGTGIAAAAVLAIGYFVVDFPPDGKNTAGTMAPAQRYRAEQPKAEDVKLGDQSIAQVMQSESFERIINDPKMRALALDPAFQTLAKNPAALANLALRADSLVAQLRSPNGLQTLAKMAAALSVDSRNVQAKALNPDSMNVQAKALNPDATNVQAKALNPDATNVQAKALAPDSMNVQAKSMSNDALIAQAKALGLSPDAAQVLATQPDALNVLSKNADAFLTMSRLPNFAVMASNRNFANALQMSSQQVNSRETNAASQK